MFSLSARRRGKELFVGCVARAVAHLFAKLLKGRLRIDSTSIQSPFGIIRLAGLSLLSAGLLSSLNNTARLCALILCELWGLLLSTLRCLLYMKSPSAATPPF